MKIPISLLFTLFYTFGLFAQCSQCPSGSTLISGNTNITDQNNANNYCISANWTGTIAGIGNGSSVTICPGVTWTLPNNLTLQKSIDINNYGTITDGPNNYKLLLNSNQMNFINQSTGTIDLDFFENQDSGFTNHGNLTADDIYLHGPSTNTGTITSTADCSGNASQSCGFFIGNKNSDFVNTGTVNTIDAFFQDGIVGGTGGTFNTSGTLVIASNGNPTDNLFIVNNLILNSSVNSGMFEISGTFDCGNNNFSAIGCYDGGSVGSTCQGNSDPVIACSTVPVEISQFNAKRIDDNIILQWEVVNELLLDYYKIEYSIDGLDFYLLAKISSEDQIYYQYVAENLNEPSLYFRLSSHDLDGTIQCYDEVISLHQTEDLRFSISPNPVDQQDFLNISLEDKADCLITIFDIKGQNQGSKFYKDKDNIIFDLKSIKTSGLYFIRISTGDKIYTEQIIIK